MTISTVDAFVNYVGDGVTREFVFEFPSFKAEWMTGFVDRAVVSGSAVLNEDQNTSPGGVFTFDVAPPVDSLLLLFVLLIFYSLLATRLTHRFQRETMKKP